MKKTHDKINKFISNYGVGLFIIAALIVSCYYGIERIFNVDFVCTNGDYQNYNVLRRFLDGQVPYKDFANYLGMGLIVLCGPLLSLNNNFAGSLFVTNMVAMFGFILFVTVIFYIFTDNKVVSAFAGILLPKLLSSDIILGLIPVYGYYIDYNLNMLAYPNNSFRIGRIFWVIILCLLALYYVKKKKADSEEIVLRTAASTPKGAATIGFIAGIGMTWSNDFGFCCIGSAFLILFILTIADICHKNREGLLWKRFLYFFPALFLGMFISIAIASQGNIDDWFGFTLGVSNWQYTYYGKNTSEKILTLHQLLTSDITKMTVIHIVIFLISMLYCLFKLLKNEATDRMIVFVFMFVSIMATHLFYIVGSGPDGFTEGTYGFVIVSVFAAVTAFILQIIKKSKFSGITTNFMLVLMCLYTGFMLFQDIGIYKSYKQSNLKADDNYVTEMNGVNRNAEQLYNMAKIVGDEEVFSMYATALEDINGKYQPTGIDYVIHALGDDNYSEYLNNLKENNYKWVQTTNLDVWPWEIWASRASWDVYKEIYSDYILNSSHAYWSLWKYEDENVNVIDVDVSVSVDCMEGEYIRIVLTSEEKRPCYVDIDISWNMDKRINIDNILTFRHVVFVNDPSMKKKNESFEGYFLKTEGHEKHIPVYMENGTGEIILTALPEKTGTITLNTINVNEIILAQR